MLKKTIVVLILLCLFSISAIAIPVSTLVKHGKEFDGQYVEITGEVIGDIMLRGEKAWLNVLSPEGIAIGVLCPAYQTKQVTYLGNYRQHGDTILVKGLFHRFFKGQGGETMVEGYAVDILRPGYPTRHPVPIKKIIFTMSLALLAGTLLAYQLHMNRKRSARK
jgi:hypothetical protein